MQAPEAFQATREHRQATTCGHSHVNIDPKASNFIESHPNFIEFRLLSRAFGQLQLRGTLAQRHEVHLLAKRLQNASKND